MRDIHKQRIIQTAIREYKESVLFGFSSSTPHAINMMEEALHMCRPYNVLGISVLENTLKEAKKKYEKELSGTDRLDVCFPYRQMRRKWKGDNSSRLDYRTLVRWQIPSRQKCRPDEKSYTCGDLHPEKLENIL